ncbi:MAG TPA: hypothetical protein VH234_01310 [Candidatus Saccharimonadales bacterium]|jgi:archaellum component FlaC|nr:hypothetical protein [Candidatus Saccharimonadales bacterium]
MTGTDYATKDDLQLVTDDLQVVKSDLLAALQKSENSLEKRLGKKIDDAIKGAIESMATVFSDGLQMISERFNEVDERFDKVDERLDRLESNSKDTQTLLIRIDNRTHDDAEVARRHTREIRALQRKIA